MPYQKRFSRGRCPMCCPLSLGLLHTSTGRSSTPHMPANAITNLRLRASRNTAQLNIFLGAVPICGELVWRHLCRLAILTACRDWKDWKDCLLQVLLSKFLHTKSGCRRKSLLRNSGVRLGGHKRSSHQCWSMSMRV